MEYQGRETHTFKLSGESKVKRGLWTEFSTIGCPTFSEQAPFCPLLFARLHTSVLSVRFCSSSRDLQEASCTKRCCRKTGVGVWLSHSRWSCETGDVWSVTEWKDCTVQHLLDACLCGESVGCILYTHTTTKGACSCFLGDRGAGINTLTDSKFNIIIKWKKLLWCLLTGRLMLGKKFHVATRDKLHIL